MSVVLVGLLGSLRSMLCLRGDEDGRMGIDWVCVRARVSGVHPTELEEHTFPDNAVDNPNFE